MRAVLDTNCFISCIGKKSEWRPVFDAFLSRKYSLCLSTDILLEYEEKFQEFWGAAVASNLLGILITAPNTSFHAPFYNFNLVGSDPDDNKFSDLYLAAEADFLVSNDTALLALNKNRFPALKVITLQDFCTLLEQKNQ